MGTKLNKVFNFIKFFIDKNFSNPVKIKGHCKACGECCRTIVFYVGDNVVKTEEQFECLKRWDKKYRNFDVAGKSDDGALYFKCKALSAEGKCKSYFFRSLSCRLYPKFQTPFFTRGRGLKSECGYYISHSKNFDDFLP